MCVLGFSQLVVLAAARRPPRPPQFGDFPRKDALDARLPPPASRHALTEDRSTTLRLRDLCLARLSEPGILTVCVYVCVCVICGVSQCERAIRFAPWKLCHDGPKRGLVWGLARLLCPLVPVAQALVVREVVEILVCAAWAQAA